MGKQAGNGSPPGLGWGCPELSECREQRAGEVGWQCCQGWGLGLHLTSLSPGRKGKIVIIIIHKGHFQQALHKVWPVVNTR